MDIEEALKTNEFAWLSKKIEKIDQELSKEGAKERKPIEKRLDQATKIVPIVASIEKYMGSNKPWKDMTKPNFLSNLNVIQNYVYKKIWGMWRDDDLRKKDAEAYERLQILSSMTNPLKLELPESIVSNPFFLSAVDDIKKLDKPSSPIKKLDCISEACNKFSSK